MATTANHVLLRRITLSASAASVTFDSIPQTGYTDLKIVMSIRSDSTDLDTLISFNGSSTSFSGKRLYGSGSGVASDSTSRSAGLVNMSSYTALTFANNEIYIPNYTSLNAKSYSVDSVTENNATAAYALMAAGLWNPGTQAAITSIAIAPSLGNFVAGSSFSLYGVADVNTTPKSAPKADGGDIIKTDGTYWYHAFLSSGSFKPQVNLTCDVLAIGGGSSGVSYYGGGGGAAGGVATATQSLINSNYTVTVGAGGAAVSYASNANAGNNTTFAGTSNVIGYAGTAGQYTTGGSGGWGFGGTSGAPQSNAGGSSYVYAGGYNEKGGGGGGAGGTGTTPAFSPGGAGGNGGAGLNTWSSWASATGTGVSGYYAGGGSGGGARDTTAGTAGSGGGGTGGANGSAGASGVANTGSGGGGAGGNANSGSGGSGIIIIRYPV